MSIANRKRPNEPKIVVPNPSDDNPRFYRVGIIAAAGFIVGLAWPGLAQIDLVPRPPADLARKPAASAELSSSPPLVPSAAPVRPEVLPQPSAAAARVKLAEIVNCVDADGKRHKNCGQLSLDKPLLEPLRSLVACDGASGQKGILSLGFDVDFDDGKLSSPTVGRSTTLPAEAAQSILACAKDVLSKIDLSGIDHTFNRYRVFYLVELLGSEATERDEVSATAAPVAAPDGSAAPSAAELQGATGRATVAWDVALIRKAPKDGAVVARVLGGTRVVVTGRQGDWYRVKYNAQGDEGFVFKSAIGM